MTRSAVIPAAALAVSLIAGCDRPPAEPRPSSDVAAGFDNAAAAQSIMQPEVVAANPPAPTPTAAAEPMAPRNVTVPFTSGATVDTEARALLDELLATLPPDTRLVLRGHSDASGGDVSNLATSRRRAEAVRDYLVAHGVAAQRVEVIALGERRPVAPNAQLDGSDDPAGRARNRRVEVEVLSMPTPPEEGVPADGPTRSAD